jgi:tetratricopeptide (TPR) repeat protein
MAAMMSLLIVTAAAQQNQATTAPYCRLQIQPPPRPVVSANDLLAPYKAKVAASRAREALDRGRYDESRKNIEHALEIYPTYALALQIRGLLKFRENRLEEACADFWQAIQFDPNLGAAYLALGMTYNRLGNFEDAIFPLSRAATILPRAWAVHYESALAYQGVGKYEAALHAIAQAMVNIPPEPDNRSAIFYIQGRVLLEMKEYPGAKQAFEQSIQQDPQGHVAKLSQKYLDHVKAQELQNGKTEGLAIRR